MHRCDTIFRLALGCLALVAVDTSGLASETEIRNPDSISHMSVKPFIRYSKTAIALAPARDADDAADITDTAGDVVTIQPRAAPAIGLTLSYGKHLNLSLAATRDQWQRRSDEGKTKSQVLEIHSVNKALQFDFSHTRVDGMYQESVPKTDIRPFQDRLFRDTDEAEILPSARLRSTTIGVNWNFDHESYDADAAFHQTRVPTASGYSPIVGSFVSNMNWSDDEPLIPQDLQTTFAGYQTMDSLSIKAFGIHAGFGGLYWNEPWFAAGQLMLGAAAASVAASPADAGLSVRTSNTLDLRGVAGYSRRTAAFGVAGYKQMLSTRLGDGGLTTSTSSIELFYRRRL